MKTISSLTFVFLLLLFKLNAQNFAPIGAEWHYGTESYSIGTGFSSVDYIKIRSEKDTIIHSILCRKIVKSGVTHLNNRPKVEYLYSSNDTVFFYDENFSEFQILYVFNLSVNDNWKIKIKNYGLEIDTMIITVDSIYTTQINGNNLQVSKVSYTYTLFSGEGTRTQSSTIIENIGDTYSMFNLWDYAIVCGGTWTTGLRCYEDTDIGFYNKNSSINCDYSKTWTSIKYINKEDEFSIYPNPNGEFIYIETKNLKKILVKITDTQAKLIFSKEIDSKEKINLDSFEKGIYFITGIFENEIIGIKKILVK